MRVAPTGPGVRFALLIGIVGFAAYNNQNNLLYLMASIGIASVIVCVAAGWISLRSLLVVGAESPDAYAGVPFREKIRLENASWLLGAFGVTVDGSPQTLSFVAARSADACHVERLFRRRGRHRGSPVVVSTEFPFGFFRLSRRLPASRDILVFPRIRTIDTTLLRADRGGVLPRAWRRGQGDEFFRLRPYVRGDHVHHIHWKTSARVDDLVVREFGDDEDERICLGFVPVFHEDGDTTEFEHLVSATASLVSHLSRSGVRFRFLSEELDLAPSRSREHARTILTYLAEVEPKASMDPRYVDNANAAAARGETVVVIALTVGMGVGTTLTPRQLLSHG